MNVVNTANAWLNPKSAGINVQFSLKFELLLCGQITYFTGALILKAITPLRENLKGSGHARLSLNPA